MTTRILLVSCLMILTIAVLSCSKSGCDYNQASNKLLALGKVQGRLIAKGGEPGQIVANRIAQDSGPISELIAKEDYQAACELADQVERKHGLNLANEQKDMITMEQLAKDGGKGSGTCSIADAAKMQMELHALLQAEVDAGRRSSDIFREFGEDTKGYAEMLSTNPSEACQLFRDLRVKYGV